MRVIAYYVRIYTVTGHFYFCGGYRLAESEELDCDVVGCDTVSAWTIRVVGDAIMA